MRRGIVAVTVSIGILQHTGRVSGWCWEAVVVTTTVHSAGDRVEGQHPQEVCRNTCIWSNMDRLKAKPV